MQDQQPNTDQQNPTPTKPKNTSQQSTIPRWRLRPEKPQTKVTINQEGIPKQVKIWVTATIVIAILTSAATASFVKSQYQTSKPKQEQQLPFSFLSPFHTTQDTPTPIPTQVPIQTEMNSDESSDQKEGTTPETQNQPGISYKDPESQTLPFDYANAINLASDARRKADLTQIATALNIYTAEFGPQPDFPTQETCIGTSPSCYDLITLLSPDYIAEFPMDPKGGTNQNTLYYFFITNEGKFTLSANVGSKEHITITRW